MSVHAVYEAAERNVCYIVVSTETPQTITNPSQSCSPCTNLPLPHSKSSPPRPPQQLAQPFAQIHHRCKYQVSSTGLNILEVFIIYLHVYMYMSQYMRICRLSHAPRLRLACALLRFHQNFRCSHMQSMDVDKDKTTILNCGLVFIYIHTLCVRAAKVLANFKMHKLI